MESFEIRLPAVDTAPHDAREFVSRALQTWPLVEDLEFVAALLTSELVTNVVRHVGQPMTVRTIHDAATLRLEVDDPSSACPTLDDPGPDDETGRGLRMVASLATDWGVTEHRDDGKTIWFELRRPQ